MNAGDLNYRVTINAPVSAKADNGEITTTYRPESKRWAGVRNESEKEAVEAGRVTNVGMYQVKMRYCAQLTTDKRLTLKFGGQLLTLDVIGVRHLPRDGASFATCRAV
ncbi:MAG: phage head closure protein [Planctomycetota bacterium]